MYAFVHIVYNQQYLQFQNKVQQLSFSIVYLRILLLALLLFDTDSLSSSIEMLLCCHFYFSLFVVTYRFAGENPIDFKHTYGTSRILNVIRDDIFCCCYPVSSAIRVRIPFNFIIIVKSSVDSIK